MGRVARVLIFGVPAAVCAAWTVFAGKDVNWDLLNYHYYAPFELLAGRLGEDFFAASAQSYLNPVGYLPFYLMVSSGWHSVLVSIALAVVHSLSISLLFLLAWRLFEHLPRNERAMFALLATGLGSATAVYWETVGTSFLDPLLVPPMLAGLLLLLGDDRHALRRALLAGVMFGLSAALKYSNAIFALAALPLAIAMPGARGAARWRTVLGYVAGGVLAVAVLAGPWLVMLAREFGNPVFPLFNAWFRSPDALPVNQVNDRFTLDGLSAALAFPFRMIALDRSLYSENFAPDLRFAALILLAVALAAICALRRTSAQGALCATDWRLFGFFSAATAMWLLTSANGRYGLIVLLLVGVCLARIGERLLPPRAARVALATLLALQLGMTVVASPARWFIAEPWSKRWLAYDVPPRALREPALYLTIKVLPLAVIAPFVNPGSSFVNFRGQHSLPLDSPRLAALLKRYRGRVRTLGRDLALVHGRPIEAVLLDYDRTFIRIGLRVDPTDCYTIAWRPDASDGLSRAANWLALPLPPHERLSAVSCALRPAPRDPAEAERERRVSALFDRIEAACPRVFRDQTAVTEPFLNGWSRNYNGLDARLETFGDHVVLSFLRKGGKIDFGRLSAWDDANATPPPPCD
ncbi:MAG: glycosyltransferase 87 family protein [Burkholderiales bacterium]